MRVATEPSAAVPNRLRACSACAGDYEDPERTAEDEEGNDGAEIELTQNEKPSHADEFPASQRTGREGRA